MVDGLAEVDSADAPIRVAGAPYETLPEDLYIPPDALRVFLEAFEGPLDLLLYLIRRQNLDILDIPVFRITQQYLAYIELMEEMAIELAGEYLLMAAMLAEIKSRMLLPRTDEQDPEDEGDPRAELVRRLAEYEQFKSAAQALDELPRQGRDTASLAVALPAMVSIGTLRIKLAPSPGFELSSSEPPIEVASFCVMERPSPVLCSLPCRTAGVVQKGSKTFP